MIRGFDMWLAGYLRSVCNRPGRVTDALHLIVGIADHFEPFRREIAPDGSVGGGRSEDTAARLVADWCDRYRDSVSGMTDADGCPPRHTFFYPQDEYNGRCLEILAGLCREGLGEIEVQIHHRNDTAGGLWNKLEAYRDVLHRKHGALGVDSDGKVRYGFVHGNWCLCNSRPDGDWCGVNNELAVLAESGCYADFTFPSAPSPTQPRMVNRIYRACDSADRPRGHDTGAPVSAGRAKHSSGLVMIPGPLGLDLGRRKFGILPRLDTGELSGANPPGLGRVDLWVKQHIHVAGRPEWVFLKLHTHGCVARNAEVLFGGQMREVRAYLAGSNRWRLHYASAREMYNIARAAEAGCEGNPGDFRDYEIGTPGFSPEEHLA